ncbi:MAG: DnaJ domain-containing protein [Oculatellaceae cyanobacterium Prado106]|jgi:tetratricopeptide (TPR) repeat protein|nr:DnaJ domain-containing protein [Oculatellaceae cyanobacterium Prado106]
MPQTTFSLDWLNQFSDPYAVLGLSVGADEHRVLKRYHAIAKLLHPDSYAHLLDRLSADDLPVELANQIFARLVNPAYQQLKQEKGRAEIMAVLRFRARRLNQEQNLLPQSAIARRLLQTPAPELEIFYEQAVVQLADLQFDPVYQFEPITQQLVEINLVYLHLKMGDPMIRERRTGIVSAPHAVPIQFTPAPAETAEIAVSYAQRHYQRAQQYAKHANWLRAVAELRDALRLEPQKSEYHSFLAKVYLMQNLKGMARVHFRQALKFNPQDPLALEYAAKLKISLDKPNRKSFSHRFADSKFFGLFARRQ